MLANQVLKQPTGTISLGDRRQVLLQKGNQHLHKCGQQKEA